MGKKKIMVFTSPEITLEFYEIIIENTFKRGDFYIVYRDTSQDIKEKFRAFNKYYKVINGRNFFIFNSIKLPEVFILCKKYLNSEVTLSDFSLQLEHATITDGGIIDDKIDALIEFAAYTVSRKLTEQDKKDGYISETELKAKINNFLQLISSMSKLPEDIKHLNLTNEQYNALSIPDRIRIENELPCTDSVCYSESYPNANYDLSKLPCVINGLLVY